MSLHWLGTEQATLIFLACLYITSTASKTSTVCGSSQIPPAYLECNDKERIHVQSITYKMTTKDCEILPQSHQCDVIQDTRRTAFSSSCNGHSSCWETISNYWMVEKCGTSFISVTVSYECISDKVIDVCSDIKFIPQDEMVYLSSPNFINPANRGPQRECVCHVGGEDLTAEILELYLIQRDERRANLTIITDREVWRSQEHKPVAYNDVLIKSVFKLRLTFDSMQLYGQVFWIRIKGVLLAVHCNGGSKSSVSNEITNSTPVSLPRSDSIKGSSSSDQDAAVAPLVILIIVVVLVVIVVVLLIYIICRLREKNPSNYSIRQLEDSGVSYIKFDYISNASSLPDECADTKTSYDLSTLPGTDPFGTKGLRPKDNQHGQEGPLNDGRGDPKYHRGASIAGNKPYVDDASVYEKVDLMEVQGLVDSASGYENVDLREVQGLGDGASGYKNVDLREVQGVGVVRTSDRFLLQRD